jgi:hypothetical protein
MTNYTKVLYDLRYNLHKDIVQTASLNDIFFDGEYIIKEPVKAVIGHSIYLNEIEPKLIFIKGIDNLGDMIAEDESGEIIYVRYMDVPLESLSEVLTKLKSKKFMKGKKTVKLNN